MKTCFGRWYITDDHITYFIFSCQTSWHKSIVPPVLHEGRTSSTFFFSYARYTSLQQNDYTQIKFGLWGLEFSTSEHGHIQIYSKLLVFLLSFLLWSIRGYWPLNSPKKCWKAFRGGLRSLVLCVLQNIMNILYNVTRFLNIKAGEFKTIVGRPLNSSHFNLNRFHEQIHDQKKWPN